MNNEFRISQFEKFYYFLTKEFPEGYIPWLFPCEKNSKNPCASAILKINPVSKGSWHHESARLTKEQCIEHIKQGYNIGISAREGDPLIIGDIDEKEYLYQMPDDTLTSVSRKRCGGHFFGWDKDGSAKINIPTDHGEIRSNNQYVLAPGSYVPFNLESEKDKQAFENLSDEAKNDPLIGYYTVGNAQELKLIGFEDLPLFFRKVEVENMQHDLKEEEEKEYLEFKGEGKYSELFKLKVSDIVGKIPSTQRKGHPLHESDTDANFSLSQDGTLGFCWRHMVSLNAVQYLCIKNGYAKCQDAGTPFKSDRKSKIKGDKKALESAYKEALKLELISEWKEKENPYFVFEKEGQAIEFIKRQPLFYDKADMWWLWNKEQSKWEMTDKTQILTSIKNCIGANVINSRERTEILNALQIVGRENMPEEIPKECIQFKDKIINVKTGEEFESTPRYFGTNPIPWKIGDSEDTPTMDRYFKEWVGEEYVQTLYEIIAYSVSSNQFMQRMFALVGGGSNGKGTFIKLLKKFVGKENCVSSELKVLSESQFATSSIYKKLVCEMGEVSHDDLKNTNQIKKLSGEDDIRYEFKGKTPFSDPSSTTCLINTNSLPTTKDKTIGFYRRWLIIDFPNQFPIKEGIIESVPDWEFENLAKKSLRLLKGLYDKYQFSNEGNVEERERKYEERSNPVIRFIEEYFEEDHESAILLKVFIKYFNQYLQNKHLRVMNLNEIKRSLKNEGFEVKQAMKDHVRGIFVLNLKPLHQLHQLHCFLNSNLYVENDLEKSCNRCNRCNSCSKPTENEINGIFICEDCAKDVAQEFK